MRLSTTLLFLALTAMLSACNRTADTGTEVDDAATPPVATPAPTPPPAAPEAPAAAATAALTATQGNAVTGELRFEATDGGVHITGQVSGLKPDTEHGFHVHEKGDCSAPDAKSAGDHFNPTSSAHGRVSAPVHHAGDTDNIVADATGVATVDTRLQGATVGDGAPTDVVGKGVIVHADPDDYTTQPTGNAGARLACGVIAAAR
jgi:Cu-Zn family superoxide dismutase